MLWITMNDKGYWKRRDWRKVRLERHPTHLCIRWFHWSWRPRVYLCYYEGQMHEQRYMPVRWGKL